MCARWRRHGGHAAGPKDPWRTFRRRTRDRTERAAPSWTSPNLHRGQLGERYPKDAIATYGDAWFETGVQVGALARGMLAVHLLGLDRSGEVEQIAEELVTMFAGAIDAWVRDFVSHFSVLFEMLIERN